jgi:hypothetical protein
VKRYILRNLGGLRRLIGGEGGYGTGKATRIVLAGVYLFVTVGVPLTHNCIPDGSCSRHFDLNNSIHCCNEEGQCGAGEGASFEERYFGAARKFGHGACLACLYSSTAKTPVWVFGGSLVTYEAESKVQVPKGNGLAKSLGWLCSHPLRGPPGITS